MKFIKKNQSMIVGILVFIIVLLLLFFIKDVFQGDDNTAIYGNRLDGRENVEITKERKDKIIDSVKDKSISTTVRVSGRIVNVIVRVKADIGIDAAKELGTPIVNAFSKEEKDYYDIQIFLENDKDTTNFPALGYKHHSKELISWTKNRTEN